jgi:mono/diheme cytochrome c family protein
VKRGGLLLLLPLLAAGCSMGWERMTEQSKYLPYDEAPSGDLPAPAVPVSAMRVPPAGTIPREHASGSDAWLTGMQDGQDVAAMPIPLTRDLLARGRTRFEIRCAPCHGLLGDGHGLVGENMLLRPPPSLLEAKGLPDGRVFRVIGDGYGLMPAYADQIPVGDRWAIVAYLHALQRSQAERFDSLSPEIRQELTKEPAR